MAPITVKILEVVTKAKDILATVKKAIPPVVAAAYIILGTDAPLVADVLSVLSALGVYTATNATR